MKLAYALCGLLGILLTGLVQPTESAPYQKMWSSYRMVHSACYLKAGKLYGIFTVESDFSDMKSVFAKVYRKGLYGTLAVKNTHSTETTKTFTVEDLAHSTTHGLDLVIVGLYDVHHTFQCNLKTEIDLSPESALWYAEKIVLEDNYWLLAKIVFCLVVTTGLLTYLTLVVDFRIRLMGEVAVNNPSKV
ncbi:membrane glycoprotein US3 [Mandrillus leucophaeus cytomegalovirus]|uniref:Membrane glycoprotein US3 n=1 Tax=Mandrillus leucophaeus cytomegalovirus TaxID=1654930 RepID=A0A0G2UHX5_9BETA|nr:membrane glycoprotein US3 [Mandrillus leucophaeus cytomegalovirus]AKI29719.1 membrane glycoprotein US3 [Mandrillus leucophaeus cytomegalovirus]